MNFLNDIKEKGINRIQFFFFLVVWFIIGLFIRVLTNAANNTNSGELSIIALLLLVAHFFILSWVVHFRMKNANIDNLNHGLAVICSFIPFLQLAPIIAGLWYKPKNSKGNIAFIKEKFNIVKNSSIPTVIATFSFLIGIGAGYIYNIIWMIDNWNHLETFSKFINVGLMIFIPPFGGIIGIYHWF